MLVVVQADRQVIFIFILFIMFVFILSLFIMFVFILLFVGGLGGFLVLLTLLEDLGEGVLLLETLGHLSLLLDLDRLKLLVLYHLLLLFLHLLRHVVVSEQLLYYNLVVGHFPEKRLVFEPSQVLLALLPGEEVHLHRKHYHQNQVELRNELSKSVPKSSEGVE